MWKTEGNIIWNCENQCRTCFTIFYPYGSGNDCIMATSPLPLGEGESGGLCLLTQWPNISWRQETCYCAETCSHPQSAVFIHSMYLASTDPSLATLIQGFEERMVSDRWSHWAHMAFVEASQLFDPHTVEAILMPNEWTLSEPSHQQFPL